MSAKDDRIRETNMLGHGTLQYSRNAVDCPALGEVGIDSIGFGDMGRGYYSGRLCPSFAHLACCTAGAGEVYCGGAWSPFRPSLAVIQPAGHAHAARSVDGGRFSFFWVLFAQSSSFPSGRAFAAPCRIEREGLVASAAVRELCAVGMGRRKASGALERACVQVLCSWLEDLLSLEGGPGRLEGLWQTVARQIDGEWDSTILAGKIGVTPTQLRRLCANECGMSPMRKVSSLRIEQAKTLLRVSDLGLDAISARLGYSNAFAFSTAFKRHAGLAPSAWRHSASREPTPPRKAPRRAR